MCIITEYIRLISPTKYQLKSTTMWLIRKHQLLFVCFLLSKPICYIAIKMDVHYCGFEQKCAGNRTDVELKTDSCCIPCECADICIEKGTCCMDKKRHDNSKHIMTQQCIPGLYPQESVPAELGVVVQFYYARTQCPDDFIDLNVKEKCESDKPKSLPEITLVSSENGSIIYKNKFCGLCHGDTKTIAWKMVALKDKDCRKLKLKQNVNLTYITEHVFSYCTVTFDRPSSVDLRSVACFSKRLVINHCNQTGEWEVYDSSLESLCLNPPESVYYIHNSVRSQVFGNLYCFLCNVEKDIDPEKCSDGYGRFPLQRLFTLIDINRWTEPEVQQKCRTDQIFDKFLDRCKYLYCPRFAVPVNGQCIPFLNIDQSYQLTVRLVPLESINETESVKNELKDKLIHNIQRKLGFEECKLCYGHAYLEKDKRDTLQEIDISIAVKHTEKCKTENIWSKVTLIERFPLHTKLTLNKKVINFVVVWDNSTSVRKDYSELINKFGSIFDCGLPFLPERGSTCPKIQLTTVEYDAVLKNHSKVPDLWFIPGKEDMNDTIFVCLEGYIMNQRATGIKQCSSLTKTIVASVYIMLLYNT